MVVAAATIGAVVVVELEMVAFGAASTALLHEGALVTLIHSALDRSRDVA
jgi:hypothetical protein